MKRVLVFAIFAVFLPRLAPAQANDRTLMHTFQEGSRVVYVTIVDLPSGPQGLVTSKDRSRREQPFTVSQAQFDKMWSTLLSAGVERYARSAGDKQPERRFDAVNYYVFSAAEMPRGFKKNYAIPNGKTPPSLVALAKQLRGYAK